MMTCQSSNSVTISLLSRGRIHLPGQITRRLGWDTFQEIAIWQDQSRVIMTSITVDGVDRRILDKNGQITLPAKLRLLCRYHTGLLFRLNIIPDHTLALIPSQWSCARCGHVTQAKFTIPFGTQVGDARRLCFDCAHIVAAQLSRAETQFQLERGNLDAVPC